MGFTKKEMLYDFIRSNRMLKTSTINKWGMRNYCNDAMRLARYLAAEGLIRRMTKEEQEIHFPMTKREKVWIVV